MLVICWKALLAYFHSFGKFNYRIEAYQILASYLAVLPKSVALSSLSNRVVNLRGEPGQNVEVDRFQEFENRDIKNMIGNLGSFANEKTVFAGSKARFVIDNVSKDVLADLDVNTKKGAHNYETPKQDVKFVLGILKKKQVFKVELLNPCPDVQIFEHLLNQIDLPKLWKHTENYKELLAFRISLVPKLKAAQAAALPANAKVNAPSGLSISLEEEEEEEAEDTEFPDYTPTEQQES